MNKTIIALLIACFCFITVTAQETPTCASNPLAAIIEQLINDRPKDGEVPPPPPAPINPALLRNLQGKPPKVDDVEDGELATAFNDAVDATTVPAIVEDLDVCSQFNGESTCCTAETIKAIKVIARRQIRKLVRKEPPILQIIKKLPERIGKCGIKEGVTEENVPHTFQALDEWLTAEDKTALESYKEAHLIIARAQARLLRGNLCALCIDPTKLSDFFDEDGKLKLDQASLDEYAAEVEAALTTQQSLITTFKAILSRFFEEFSDSSVACGAILTKINEFLDNPDNKPCKGDDSTECKKGCKDSQNANIIGDGCAERTGKDIQDPNDERLRILQTTVGAVECAANDENCLITYIASAEDDLATADGITISDPVDDNGATDASDNNSSLLNLSFVLLAICLMILN